MKFSDIPGHESVKSRLRKMADEERLPHALLLEGPSGIGKYALAQAFSQYIHCQNKHDGDSCGTCPSCIRHNAMSDIDTHYVFPVVKKEKDNRAPISDDYLEDWKEYIDRRIFMDFDTWTNMLDKKNAQPLTYVTESDALIHKLSYAAHDSKYKIVVWWLPEKMNIEAANKILKMIEEPYDDTLFVMASDNPAQIIPTIYSRLQRIWVSPLSDREIAAELTENYAIDPQDAMMIGHNANGSMTAAIKALDSKGDNDEFLQSFIKLMRLAYQRKIGDLRDWANDLAAWGREKEIKFYDYASRLIRENFVYNFKIKDLNYMNREENNFSVNFARFITERNVEKLMDTFTKAKIDIAGNGNGKIINLDVAVKVILLLKQ